MTVPARLVGDVGGTNARFALLDEHGVPTAPSTLRVADYPDLVSAVRHFLQVRAADDGAPATGPLQAAAIAVATPVIGDRVKLTNSHWSWSIQQTREELALDTLHLVNDFTALALSVPHLPSDQLDAVGGGALVSGHAKAIIGPGTGLGVSGLVPCGTGWTALQGEGGHITLGGSTARDQAVHAQLAARYPHVSAERFLSGPGLINIVQALRVIDGVPGDASTPADVTRLGLSNEDAVCREALQMFCRLLGKVAGNLVLTLGAQGGCYIGGGVVPRLGRFFHESDFRAAFEAKGRMTGYLDQVPTFVIHSPYPALVGAAQLL